MSSCHAPNDPEIGHDGLPVTQQRSIVVYRDGEYREQEDLIAAEYALTIYLNDKEFATIVCTPEYLEDLVIGFLASEGVIRHTREIRQMAVNRRRGTVRVVVNELPDLSQALYNKRYIGSCCGKSRQSFYFQSDAMLAKPVLDDVTITPEQVFALMDLLDADAGLFDRTGGVHIAGIAGVNGECLTRTDIGRHNALDKLYGHALQTGLSLQGKVVTFSGRLSSEVLLKVAKIGAGIILCRSAPTALALTIAEDLNLTAVGFIREGSFNVYTHPWRIINHKGLL